MTTEGAGRSTTWARRWGTVLAGVSIIGTILAVLSVLLLSLVVAGLAEDFGGGAVPWWYWLVALGFAAAGVVGLLLTSSVPTVAYLLRLVALLPLLSLGFASPWLMLPAVLVGAAHVSLMLSRWTWTRRTLPRVLSGLATAVLLSLLVVPVEQELSCENPGDPPATCDVWYVTVLGWGGYEDDDRDLTGWILVALAGGLVVGLPVARDEDDAPV